MLAQVGRDWVKSKIILRRISGRSVITKFQARYPSSAWQAKSPGLATSVHVFGMSIDAQILKALRRAVAVSGSDLSRWLGISRAAVWARIQELRKLGYGIEASPHQGYRLKKSPDAIHADDLLARLDNIQVVGRDIRVFQETDSTNDIVEKMARDGVDEGVAVFAESQTRGRGRLGRRWMSPSGRGLWLSVLLRPVQPPAVATRFTIAAATAVRRAVQNVTSLEPEIKWPNDLTLRDRKFSGILTEMHAEPDRILHITLGLGVNVNLDPSEFPPALGQTATSLQAELGRAVDRPALAAEILSQLDLDYARVREGGFNAVAAEWRQACSTMERQVNIRVGDRVIEGRAESLDSDGALLIRTPHGHLERITSGDVSLEK